MKNKGEKKKISVGVGWGGVGWLNPKSVFFPIGSGSRSGSGSGRWGSYFYCQLWESKFDKMKNA